MSLGVLALLIEGGHELFNSDELKSSRINAKDCSVCVHTCTRIVYVNFLY